MALKVTSWPEGFDYRVVYEDNATNTASKHVTGTSGKLHSVTINNSQGTDSCFLKIADSTSATPGTTEPDWLIRCGSANTETYSIPWGISFSNGISFWLTRNEVTSDTTVPALSTNGTVKVTILTSSS